MYRVGLTGGIGSGKSTVSELFSKLGVNIVDTDIISHQITQPDGLAYQAIINTFGDDIICDDNTIDRKKLADIIFHSKERKELLESLLHPLIWIIVEQQITLSDSPYSIVVVPLLFEGKHQARFHETLLIHCPEKMQIDRIKQRDQHRSKDDIQAIIKNQISTEEKIKSADRLINNTSNIEILTEQVKELHRKYLEQATKLI